MHIYVYFQHKYIVNTNTTWPSYEKHPLYNNLTLPSITITRIHLLPLRHSRRKHGRIRAKKLLPVIQIRITWSEWKMKPWPSCLDRPVQPPFRSLLPASSFTLAASARRWCRKKRKREKKRKRKGKRIQSAWNNNSPYGERDGFLHSQEEEEEAI